MTQAERHPELNPLDMEHRVTVLEQAGFRLTEQVGNTSKSVERLASIVQVNEERRVAELVAVHTSIEDIITGIATRRQMDEERAKGFTAGQQSVTVKLPLRQLLGAATTVAALIGAVEVVVKLWI